MFCLWCAPALAQTFYVSPGSSIQAAIDQAINGDTIVVSSGTYHENIDFHGKAITVCSTDPNDPNVVAATIIDGSTSADPNTGSVVTFKSGEGNSSKLSGFTITGGTGTWIVVAWSQHEPYWNRCGGGVICYNLSQPKITKNVFLSNMAGEGGGIYVYGDPVNINNPSNPAVHLTPVITDNTFITNQAIVAHGYPPPNTNYPATEHGDGGAIVCFQGVDALIANNIIKNNHADFYGGGMHFRQWSNGLIEDNQIIGNGSSLGAGIHITYASAPTVKKNLIKGNQASSLGGGGIYVYNESNPLIEKNTITQNKSINGAGMAVFDESNPAIRNNLIVKNIDGAGIRLRGASMPVITNNTIAGNMALYSTTGGGINCDTGSIPIIKGNIITSNNNGGIYTTDIIPLIQHNDVWANSNGNYNSVIGDKTGIDGNISVDPCFVNSDVNNYALNYSSKCINSGDPNFIPGTNETDYEGDQRILGQFVDIGADEAYPVWNITSGGQYTAIQQGIDDANNGEIIIVTQGRHTSTNNRDIDFKGKAITVQSSDPNKFGVVRATIIDCNGSQPEPHRGFIFNNGEDGNSILAGLTITNGGGFTEGGAIYCGGSSPSIRNCIITENSADYGGGICSNEDANVIATNCIISGNTAIEEGGGFYTYASSPGILNCTVIGNRAQTGGAEASCGEGNMSIVNCIFRDNRATDGNQIALREYQQEITEVTVSYSDIEGGQAGVRIDPDMLLNWGSGNIDADPNFIDGGRWDDAGTPMYPDDDFFISGDYHIPPQSPCVDAGDNNPVPAWLKDIDGQQRIFNGTVDIGADEVVTSPFDLNRDGIVDYSDLAVMADEWLQSGDLRSDFYENNTVNFADYALFIEHWLEKSIRYD